MKKILIVILFITSFCFSQDKVKKDPFKNKGYFNITRYSHLTVNKATLDFTAPDNSVVSSDTKQNGSNGNSLTTINGYFLSPRFSLGLGLGFERFNEPNSNHFPIFLDARYYLDNDFNTFYAFANGGVFSKLDESFNKGGFIGAGIGYKFFIDDNRSICLVTDVGYYHRLIKLNFQNNPNESDLILNGVSLSLGLLF